MTMPITDKEPIKYILEIIDENSIKEALRELYPTWDL